MSSSICLKGRVLKEEQGAGASSSPQKKNSGHSTTHHHQANIQFPFEYNLAPGVYLLEVNEASPGNPPWHRLLLKPPTLVALYL